MKAVGWWTMSLGLWSAEVAVHTHTHTQYCEVIRKKHILCMYTLKLSHNEASLTSTSGTANSLATLSHTSLFSSEMGRNSGLYDLSTARHSAIGGSCTSTYQYNS